MDAADELESPEDDFACLTTCWDATEARSLQAWLEAHDLPCFVQGEQSAAIIGRQAIQLRILVPRSKLELAQSVLQARSAPLLDGELDDDGSLVDLATEGPEPRRWLRWVAILVLAGPLVGAFALRPRLRPAHPRATPGTSDVVARFTEGCDRGRADFCAQLGVLYSTGQGVARDLTHAAALYRKACDLGDPTACARVARTSR
jgi:Putative prokaryotic signal transducing protein